MWSSGVVICHCLGRNFPFKHQPFWWSPIYVRQYAVSATSTICDQACLHALSHSSGTSSGWLKALPQPSLGLAISPHDFIITLHLWLGVLCFSVSHVYLSICYQSIWCPSISGTRYIFQFLTVPVYHPDFHLGCPAYFDLSVRCSTQSAVISSAASQAGVAATAGEEVKDNHYLSSVNSQVGDFFH